MRYKIVFTDDVNPNAFEVVLEKACGHIHRTLNDSSLELEQHPINSRDNKKVGSDYVYTDKGHVVAIITRVYE